jgi:hypothetical protein
MNGNLLKAVITKNGENLSILAEAMGMPTSALSQRISGRVDFRRNEIRFIKNRYKLTCEEVDMIFFEELVSA